MPNASRTTPYRLDDQISFILHQINRRYTTLFANGTGSDLTPTQWAVLVRLGEAGPCPQNQLSRLTTTDVATIKGVVECLDKRRLVQRSTDPDDGQRPLVSLSPAERVELEVGLVAAREINRQALAPLSLQEQGALRGLPTRLV